MDDFFNKLKESYDRFNDTLKAQFDIAKKDPEIKKEDAFSVALDRTPTKEE